jgi:hypothetical protein
MARGLLSDRLMTALSVALSASSLTAAMAFSSYCGASEAKDPPHDDNADYLMPGAGHLSGSVATGIPFLALGEVAYGISDGFALGVLGGVTPIVSGIGVRPRGVLLHWGEERFELVVPVLYYPRTGDREPWVLARPTLSFEHAFSSGARANFGLGVVGASCIESILTLGHDHDVKFMGGAWDTVAVGGALPLSRRASLFGEATAILAGVRPAGRDWVGGPPLVVALGVESSL